MTALTVPFWVLGAVSGLQLLPGVPVAALAVVCPILAAVILVYRDGGESRVRALLTKSFDNKRIEPKIWFALVLLLPAVALLSFIVMRAIGVPIPTPRIAILEALGLLTVCFVAALAEELGWTGYATDPMQERWNGLWTGVLLGLFWAAWHFIPLLQTGRSATWIAWWSLGTVSLRVVMVGLYNNAGKSVFAVTFFHAMSNVCWQLFPIHGSYFDPRINGIIMFCLAAMVAFTGGMSTPAHRRSR